MAYGTYLPPVSLILAQTTLQMKSTGVHTNSMMQSQAAIITATDCK